MHLKQQSNKKIESLEEIVKKLKAELKAIQGNEFDRINFLKEQLQKEQTHLSNILSHSLVNVVLVAVSAKTPTFTDMQKSIISTILLNSSSSYKHFSEREKDFWISGETYLRIEHQLMALHGQDISDIKEVKSHPMAIYQCYDFLNQYEHIHLTEAADTALVAQQIKENNLTGVAAIGSKLAAEIYGLNIIAEGIETSKVNYTRFIIISRDGEYTSLGNADKASIYLRVPHAHGSLLKVIEKIAQHGINISKLQSFPVLGELSQYYFHLDLEFDDISRYENCLEDLKAVSHGLDELGIYKKATTYDYQSIS